MGTPFGFGDFFEPIREPIHDALDFWKIDNSSNASGLSSLMVVGVGIRALSRLLKL